MRRAVAAAKRAAMRYISTRGTAPTLDFREVTLAGLAADGGLYVPESWPALSRGAIAGLAGKSYVETAVTVMAPFTAVWQIAQSPSAASCRPRAMVAAE